MRKSLRHRVRLCLFVGLTHGGDQRVGEEHGGRQVPAGRVRGVPEDGDAVLAGRQHLAQEVLQRRGGDAAAVQELVLQRLYVPPQAVLHRPLDAGEDQRAEQQVDDVEEQEAGEQQPRLTCRMHDACEARSSWLRLFQPLRGCEGKRIRGCPNRATSQHRPPHKKLEGGSKRCILDSGPVRGLQNHRLSVVLAVCLSKHSGENC